MKMPFDGFYLKLLDEQNGTHEYEEYLRNCKENPLTEEEQREWTESARAAIAELERINAEPEPTRQSAEPEAEAEGIPSPRRQSPPSCRKGAVPFRRQRKRQRWKWCPQKQSCHW